MFFYEQEHSGDQRYLYHQFDTDLQFPIHMHHSFECIYVEEGALELQVNGAIHTVRAGEAALILPDQLHAYATPAHSYSYLCIFSPDYLYDFYTLVSGMEAAVPVFRLPDPGVIALLGDPSGGIFQEKAALYTIAACFLAQCPLRPRAAGDDAPLERIIGFVQEHFAEPITLREVAAQTGYHYNYLSGWLHRQLHMNFSELVNRHRIDRAAALLTGTALTVTEIAEQCGFGTIRSFNRNFRLLRGMTPRDFRAQAAKS